MAVVRADGWPEDDGSLLERSASIGGGYTPDGLESLGSRSQLGFGLNWEWPNDTLFGADLDNQHAVEVYFRWQVADEIVITSSAQLLIRDRSFLVHARNIVPILPNVSCKADTAFAATDPMFTPWSATYRPHTILTRVTCVGRKSGGGSAN